MLVVSQVRAVIDIGASRVAPGRRARTKGSAASSLAAVVFVRGGLPEVVEEQATSVTEERMASPARNRFSTCLTLAVWTLREAD